jgi:hypothetical protein
VIEHGGAAVLIHPQVKNPLPLLVREELPKTTLETSSAPLPD